MEIFCIILLVYLVFAEPFFEIFSVRVFTREFGERTDARVRLYQGGVFRTWATLAVILVAFAVSGTSVHELGLTHFDFSIFRGFSLAEKIISLAIVTVYVSYLLGPVLIPLVGGRAGRDWIARKIEYVVFITPETSIERFWWLANSFSTPAEEIVYRGFTIYAVALLWPDLPFWILIIVAGGVIDGLRHGFRPAVSAQVIFGGVALALAYKLTGAIWPTIAVKLFHDLRVLAFPLAQARRNLAERGLSEIPGKTLTDQEVPAVADKSGNSVEPRTSVST
ncbi:CPBP family glutamic-type intramembrane protease [Nocardia iowensis]|uniref:CPBP family intramembrane metalloprotease n=1 Tax=Nocardia iowensis TaxID=204891 RepID=A0ABX8RZ01_NOCIO|nr:CPBP family glutamic-type intramembrane protease [Nocardia iowensis]QXN94904.1 CPBP family intramembrane metalloprotease [Nocardia iowensis]